MQDSWHCGKDRSYPRLDRSPKRKAIREEVFGFCFAFFKKKKTVWLLIYLFTPSLLWLPGELQNSVNVQFRHDRQSSHSVQVQGNM